MPSFLITGASRGLGLAFTKELLKLSDSFVIATARDTENATGLQALLKTHTGGRLVLLDMDVTKPMSINDAALAAEKLLPNGLDHLISNAGISLQPLASFDDLNLDKFQEELDFNLIAPIHLIRTFLPLIRRSGIKRIMVISSQLGSIEIGFQMENLCNAYAIAKAGLNMLIRKWSAILKHEGIVMFLIHPGWIAGTDIGSGIIPWVKDHAPDAPRVSENESAMSCLEVLRTITLEGAGSFYSHDGGQMPW